MTVSSQDARDLVQAAEGAVPVAFVDGTAARVTVFNSNWEFAEVPAGSGFEVSVAAALSWRPAIVPGTVAGSLRAIGELDGYHGNDLDERAFVFRRRFVLGSATSEASLIFDGLATLADVWLNGACILSTRNMFRSNAVDVGPLLRGENELILHFRALMPELMRKRPRGRWTTRLVNHRNLRYVRTTLLGRIPGWAPLHPPVGPWRGIRLLECGRVRLSLASVRPALDGSDGVVSIALRGRFVTGVMPEALEVRIADSSFVVPTRRVAGEEFEAVGEVRLSAVKHWWCHDLGTPHLYAVALALKCGDESIDVGIVRIGFRRIQLRRESDERFGIQINGRNVFCRGACWAPVDPVGYGDDPEEIRRVLQLVKDAGMNMLRVNATMTYESDAFYDACDELGILVWQDFMFARMSYPEDDAEFAEEVRMESEQVLARLHQRACLAVLCGNSEVEQQAAMLGLPLGAGNTPLFSFVLKEACRRWCPGTPYVCSSPSGGAMPFHVETGVAHYFGVGAYLRPPEDAQASRVGFASECLAFSNVPEDRALEELFGEEVRTAHSPRYKQGVPRDSGAGWDFADVTDHYIEQLFQCNVRALRYVDTERYLALARVAPGELMERAFGVWRAEGSVCHGALVWFLRDIRTGSGWGILDSAGRPKAPYWFLKRACAPRAIWFTDEGLNGLRVHIRNDRPEPLDAQVRIRLIRSDGVEIGKAESAVGLEGGAGRVFDVDSLLGRFTDANRAYRFGPCEHAIAVADLLDLRGVVISTANHLPAGLIHELRDDIALRAVACARGDGSYELRVKTRELAMFVRIAVDGFLPNDNYFHVAPGGARSVVLLPREPAQPLRGAVTAVNARLPTAVGIEERAE